MNNTFIIVTWNNEKQIGKLIDSINIYEPNSSIIVVDNASSDKTVQLVKQRENVQCIESKINLGFSKANNLAFEKVKTKFVTFINPDTYLVEGILENLRKDIEKDNNGLIGCKLLNDDGSLQPSIFAFQTPFTIFIEQFRLARIMPQKFVEKYSPENTDHKVHRSVDWLMGAFLFTKSDYYRKVGGFSEDYFLYAEDMDICYKYHKIGLNVFFDPSVSIRHSGGKSEEKTSSLKSVKLLKSFCIFAEKYNIKGNIKMLYYSYKIKFLISKILNLSSRSRYYKNICFLKGKIDNDS